jgi:hypothetical protein
METNYHKGDEKMKRYARIFITAVLFLTVAGALNFFMIGPPYAAACGYGSSGGADYVPQRNDSAGYLAKKSAITQEQARDIVAGHVSRLNPDLEIGNINDAGSFFEAEILSRDNEVLQLLGVDKFSGRLMLLN